MILSFLADNQIDPPERWNYLKRCGSERRWRELGRELFRPIHYQLYRLKQAALRRDRYPDSVRFKVQLEESPKINKDVPDLFANQVTLPGAIDGISRLFGDVDRQLKGVYRLAGGGYHPLNPAKLSCLEDFEDHHAFQRLYWASRYAQAAAFGHTRAEEGLRKDLAQWLETDWSCDRFIAYPYTTSERIASLAESLVWITRGHLHHAASLIVPIKTTIWRDAAHLAENVEYRLGPHNHILNNARALYLASAILLELKESTTWRTLAFKLWDEFFPKLILPDGSFSEATSFYLVMTCRTALEYLLASRKHDHQLAPELTTRLSRFFELGNELQRSDGSVPRFGNSSPDHIAEDLWGIFTAAHVNGYLKTKPRHSIVTPLATYYGYFASQGANNGNDRDTFRESIYSDGGWAFLRQPETEVELAIHADPRTRTYTHGDAGRGSFELWWRGTVLIREPGNVSYTTSKRHWYRSGAAQNVTCLNGLGPGISQEYQRQLPAWYSDVQSGGSCRLNSGGYSFTTSAFQRLAPEVELERRWYWKGVGVLVMEEELEGAGTFSFVSRLHLGDAPWNQRSQFEYECMLPDGEGKVMMQLRLPKMVTASLKSRPFAPEYGSERSGRSVEMTGEVTLPAYWIVEWQFTLPSA